jgi:hypothetical protein
MWSRTGAAIAAITMIPATLTGCGGGTTAASKTVTVTSTVVQSQVVNSTVTYTPPPPPGPARQLTTEGIYVVGDDIVTGRWRTAGGQSCYWARLGDLTGDEILDNSNSVGPQVVDILPSDVAFQLRGCADWYLDE